MESNIDVELKVEKRSCQNLVKESCNIWIKLISFWKRLTFESFGEASLNPLVEEKVSGSYSGLKRIKWQ